MSRQDPNSVVDYCYDSAPASALTGVRSFNGSGAGAIYMDPAGVPLSTCPVPNGTAFLE